jgi:uncharacterized membrane protein
MLDCDQSGVIGALDAAVCRKEPKQVQDLLALVFTIVFFVVALLYVQACERLR